ncbi:molybdenum cofactor cytidylyltransferase [Kushneria sinocarnis]|uniref:Molybdenum cofactor cytidylyltransferase n=1 Tax=Kushneria sinocarnis TaxID=595502 RepID=A0A420WV77_9GAMM|nr:nucleotidyltransferase family protein [Kushneria sinocarnis]RKR02434.1 molybdenum cofactor cytidylyltransferase [Kushneria sinocarnis]
MSPEASRHRAVALVLAAGRGRRFGSDKRLARLADGRPLLVATLESLTPVFDEILLVVRREEAFNTLALPPRVSLVHAERADEGMGASLATGVTALLSRAATPSAQALAVLLGDMPWLARDTLETLVARTEARTITRPAHDGRPGHPVLFGRDFWPLLAEQGGDTGGREVIRRYRERVVDVPVSDPGIHRDVDYPADLGLSSPD